MSLRQDGRPVPPRAAGQPGSGPGSFGVVCDDTVRTAEVAGVLAAELSPGDVVLLTGGLASGKTTFVTALAAALGSRDRVTSPTFTLAHFYRADRFTLLHIDAYRLSGPREYRDLGLDEYTETSVTVVEWGDKIAEDFPCHLMIDFAVPGVPPDARALTFCASCPRWLAVLPRLRRDLTAAASSLKPVP
jgi:tRNA threonylcarbamoyladenosine biosynthesis protein TsaE